jgi:CRP-like cAMP-binding protein
MSEINPAELARFSKLFEVLDDAARKALLSLSKKQKFEAGAVICKEGDEGDAFFVVTAGKVKVQGDNFGEAKDLDTLGAGQFFGEVALLSNQKRQATVTALEATELVVFPKVAVEQVLKTAPKARELLQKVGLYRTEDAMRKMME